MSVALHSAPTMPAKGPAPIRVMVVDDAVVVRGLVSRWIAEQPGLAVVASITNGRQAVDQLERADPDVVVLDRSSTASPHSPCCSRKGAISWSSWPRR